MKGCDLMICKYCGSRIIYTQIKKKTQKFYKSFLISDDGSLKQIDDENCIAENNSEEFAICEKCGCPYYFEKSDNKVIINDIIEKRLKNTIYNYIKRYYDDYSKSSIYKFISENCLNKTEILNYIQKDYPLSEVTIRKLILIFSPSQDIIDYWMKFYSTVKHIESISII